MMFVLIFIPYFFIKLTVFKYDTAEESRSLRMFTEKHVNTYNYKLINT